MNMNMLQPQLNNDQIYNRSEAGKARTKRYINSDKGRLIHRLAEQKYNQTDKGIIRRDNYNHSDKHKIIKKKFYQTTKGKLLIKKSNQSENHKLDIKKYQQSEKGKLKMRLFQDKYRQSDKGVYHIKARLFVKLAILAGRLIKKNVCEKCSKIGQTDIHHLNYELDPTFKNILQICKECHNKIHQTGTSLIIKQ